jgi:hypothetical protein
MNPGRERGTGVEHRWAVEGDEMAKTITVTEAAFKEAFDATLKELELTKLKNDRRRAILDANEAQRFVEEMHRSFHFHVCGLRDRLEKA